MIIDIDQYRRISEIQSEFNALYPFLKIEFFSRLHPPGTASARALLENNNKLIGAFASVKANGKISITPGLTVQDVEQLFGDAFGLGVQIFRKSGEVWLETTVTDSWTLEKQNQQGLELSGPAGE